jgi:hypothetical protein
MLENFLYVILSSFAVFRISYLLVYEDGFLHLSQKIRILVGAETPAGLPIVKYKGFSEIFNCFYCNSVWVSIPFGFYLGENIFEKILFITSIAGLSLILKEKALD